MESPADTFIVDQNEDGDFFTIQEAVDASTDGDTIRVNPGIYHENAVVNNSVHLIGNDFTDTIVDGSGNVIILESNGITMSGCTVQRGGNAAYEDAGIRVESDNVGISPSRSSFNLSLK